MLINNAGISPSVLRPDAATNPVLFYELTGDDLRRFLGVHTVGPLMLARGSHPR